MLFIILSPSFPFFLSTPTHIFTMKVSTQLYLLINIKAIVLVVYENNVAQIFSAQFIKPQTEEKPYNKAHRKNSHILLVYDHIYITGLNKSTQKERNSSPLNLYLGKCSILPVTKENF